MDHNFTWTHNTSRINQGSKVRIYDRKLELVYCGSYHGQKEVKSLLADCSFLFDTSNTYCYLKNK